MSGLLLLLLLLLLLPWLVCLLPSAMPLAANAVRCTLTKHHIPPPAGRKKRKGAGGSDSDSDGGADSPDGVHAGTLTLAQPQQGLADLAQKFMAMLTTVGGWVGGCVGGGGGDATGRCSAGQRCCGAVVWRFAVCCSGWSSGSACKDIPAHVV